MKTEDLLQHIVKERPVGTDNNERIISLLKEDFLKAGCKVTLLPFKCLLWRKGDSVLEIGDVQLKLEASPYSRPFSGTGEALVIETLEALHKTPLKDQIIILRDEAAQRAIQPKDYPFYYPEEDRDIILRLESQKPKAIIAMTGQSQLSGMNPFPLFTDGNFSIPSGYMSEENWHLIKEEYSPNRPIALTIASENNEVQSSQLIAHKKGVESRKKVVVCAHMDTQYETMGALDNATGVAVLMAVMEGLATVDCPFDIDFVPFNTEEYFGANGEVGYLEYLDKEQENIALVINVDSPCQMDSNTAVSYYNFNTAQECLTDETIGHYKRIEKGEAWYAGDHCAFAFRGIPCLAVSSSNLFEGALAHTHTPQDTLRDIDKDLIELTAAFLVGLIKNWSNIIE